MKSSSARSITTACKGFRPRANSWEVIAVAPFPGGLAVDRAGSIYVAPLMNHKVCVYSTEGKLLSNDTLLEPLLASLQPVQQLFVFPGETTALVLVAAHLRTILKKEPMWAADFISVVSWCKETAIQEVIAEYAGKELQASFIFYP
jgi:hypothetical protein